MNVPKPKHREFKDLEGLSFNRYLVVSYAGKIKGTQMWNCVCDCGTERIAQAGNLLNGHSKSCGCFGREVTSKRSITHGESGKAGEYQSWRSMLDRCRRPSSPAFVHYGKRGIGVCDRWLLYKNFLADMGRKPSSDHSLDRIDNNGNYEPSNCRWATPKEQSRNRRNGRLLTWNGKTQCVAAWAEELRVGTALLYYRVNAGWSTKDALTCPSGGRRSD